MNASKTTMAAIKSLSNHRSTNASVIRSHVGSTCGDSTVPGNMGRDAKDESSIRSALERVMALASRDQSKKNPP
jgi:hypothetical protein